MKMIDEYDKILLTVLTLLFGSIFAMITRHASKLASHQRILDRISGQLDSLPSTAELVVRKIIEGHELREQGKFDAITDKLEEVRLEIAGLVREPKVR